MGQLVRQVLRIEAACADSLKALWSRLLGERELLAGSNRARINPDAVRIEEVAACISEFHGTH